VSHSKRGTATKWVSLNEKVASHGLIRGQLDAAFNVCCRSIDAERK